MLRVCIVTLVAIAHLGRVSDYREDNVASQIPSQLCEFVSIYSHLDGCWNFAKTKGWNYPGNDIGTPTIQNTYGDCCAFCSVYANCKAFTWDHESKYCYLKSSVGNGGYSSNSSDVGHRLGMCILRSDHYRSFNVSNVSAIFAFFFSRFVPTLE